VDNTLEGKMELKIYLRFLLRKWWIVLPTFLIIFTSTVVFTFAQRPTFRSTATFVVSPSSSFQDARSFLSGLDVLNNKDQVVNTYAQVATSLLIRKQIAEALKLSPAQETSLTVESRLRAGTNVIEISVEGNDPVLVADFANKIGEKTIEYVEKLYEVYDLKPLDPATPPTSPIRPDKKLNLALGAVLGLALGVGLPFLVEYLHTPLVNMVNQGFLDSESGAYSLAYFAQRLGEEMSRAKRNNSPLSLALIDVDQLGALRTSLPPQFQSEALHKITTFLKQYLRGEDVMARLDGTVFAILLPDTPQEQAKAAIEKLQTKMAWTAFEIENSSAKLNLSGVAGIVAYNFNGTGQTELLDKAKQALQQAEAAGFGKVITFSEDEEHGQA
jgi:diguanylate cyclase (GGDEF)-like protein